jgi:hypothetical protein
VVSSLSSSGFHILLLYFHTVYRVNIVVICCAIYCNIGYLPNLYGGFLGALHRAKDISLSDFNENVG